MIQFIFRSIAVIFLFLFLSCGENSILTETTVIGAPEPSREIYTPKIHGVVVDESGNPVSDADVTLKVSNTTTDEFGYFEIEGVLVRDNGSLITAERNGYYPGYKLVYPEGFGSNYVKIQLVPREIATTFNASEDFSHRHQGVQIDLPASALITATGDVYDGEVSVYMHWYDPSSTRTTATMPGDLRGYTSNNEFVQLATYGMVAIEMKSAAGRDLQLDEGMEATVRFPIPQSIQGGAPDIIPTWSFDEVTGSWIEEGEAIKDGDTYVANLPHFSFWNCDAPFPVIEVEGQFVTTEGTPIAFTQVEVKVADDESLARSGYTNSNGIFQGKLPKDETLKISLINDCEEVIFTTDVRPISESTILDPFVVSNGITLLSGLFTDCNGAAVTNGYIVVNSRDSLNAMHQLIFIEEDGSFERAISGCQAQTLDIIGYDLDAFTSSETIMIDIGGLDNVDIGTISLCEQEIEEIFLIEIDGEEYPFINVDFREQVGGEFIVSAFGFIESEVSVALDDISVGTRMPLQFNLGLFVEGEDYRCYGCTNTCTDLEVTIVRNDTVLEGTISGMTEDNCREESMDLTMISGLFRVNK